MKDCSQKIRDLDKDCFRAVVRLTTKERRDLIRLCDYFAMTNCYGLKRFCKMYLTTPGQLIRTMQNLRSHL